MVFYEVDVQIHPLQPYFLETLLSQDPTREEKLKWHWGNFKKNPTSSIRKYYIYHTKLSIDTLFKTT